MRPSSSILACAATAACVALGLAGCNYAQSYPALPGPGGPPTFAPGVVAEEKVPTAAATPFGITTGPDGNLWFTELNGNKIGKVVAGTFPTAGSIVECGSLPTGGSGPADITSVSGSADVWFDEFANNKIAKVNTSTCNYTEYTIPTSQSQPSGLTGDQSGVLWFAESASAAAKITKMTTNGTFTEYPVGLANSDPVAVVIANDNSVWYLDSGRNSVGHLTFPGGVATFSDYGIPSNPAQPAYITLGPDGNLWFTEEGIATGLGCQIGQVVINQNPPIINEYLLPYSQPAPDGDLCLGIAGAGGDVWFGEADTGAIGRIANGTVTEYGIPGNGTTALVLTKGPDGNIWFTDGGFDPSVTGIGTNQIGRVIVANVPAFSTLRKFKAKVSTHRLPLLNFHGFPVHR